MVSRSMVRPTLYTTCTPARPARAARSVMMADLTARRLLVAVTLPAYRWKRLLRWGAYCRVRLDGTDRLVPSLLLRSRSEYRS